MRTVYSLTILLASSLIGEAGETHYSYAFGKRYAFEISDEALRRTPKWQDDSENPPISARQAIKAADELRRKLVPDTDDFKWFRESASINFIEEPKRCVWEVIYVARFQQRESTGRPMRLSLFVLMDGTIVQPEVTDVKKR